MRLDDIEDVYELSTIQEGLLFHSLFSPGTGVYLEQIQLTLVGELDVAAYRTAWQSIVDRHPILRTSFHTEAGKALQVVHRTVELPWTELDWRESDEAEQAGLLADLALADRMRGFRMEEAPLMRAALIRRGEDSWTFFWSFSHLLMDGWSFGLVFSELADLYTAGVTGATPALARPRPYRDYLKWWQQRDRTASDAFWRDHLAGFTTPGALEIGAPPSGDLPPDEPSHGVLPVPQLVAAMPRMAEFSRQHGLTLNTVMQGAWMVLLSRYLGRRDVIAGSTGTQRPADLAGAEHIMGPMLATMPVRADVDPDRPLVDWLRDLQSSMATAREHAEVSLAELRHAAALPGSAPLFEMDLAFENVPVPDLGLPGVRITESRYDGRPHFPITMIVMPGDDAPEPRLVFDRTRFSEPAAARLVRHFETLLDGMASTPDATLGELPVLPPEERSLVLGEWQRTSPVDGRRTLPEVFAERVAYDPHAVAVECGEESLTYRELDERANRLARHLVSLGAGPGQRVGLRLARTPDLVVGVLGTLKSGAAYVPLDLGQPAERMAYVLGDSGARILVTHAAAGDAVPEFDGTVVDLAAAAIAALPADAPETGPSPDDLAYVIYTSGSTGKPKGVQLTHANVVRLVAGAATRFDLGPADGWSLFHSYAFDVSVFEMWGAFGTGGRLVVVPHDATRNPEALHAVLREHRVTVFSQTPSAFRQYAAVALGADDQPPLRYVVFAGEALDVGSLQDWMDRFGDDSPRLVNMYGITEVTVHCTFHVVLKSELDSPVRGDVGRPLPDVRLYLLDERGEPVPIGVRGEICVAGPAVARGYQNLPELTAERFVSGPDGERMYRSGDLARFGEDGSIQFLGRADFQVKIRGFRVEPDEVAAVLRARDGVADAAVLAREYAPGDMWLVAWVVGAVGEAELREAAVAALPEYMVPSAFVLLDELPLTANGKLDRAALPEPDGTRPDVGAFVAPRDEREEKVAAIWRDVLGVEQVGVHDDFFALGGHSLLATRVVFALRAAFGVEVPVRLVFDRPTVAALTAGLPEPGGEGTTAIPRATRRARTGGSVA
jgi:surfactin family lipopeptide synthetase C